MSVIYERGKVVQRVTPERQADTNITEDTLSKPEELVKYLQQHDKAIANLTANPPLLRKIWRGEVFDGTGTTKYRYQHTFGGRVVYRLSNWVATTPPGADDLQEDDESDGNTLVLVSYKAGTGTLIVERDA